MKIQEIAGDAFDDLWAQVAYTEDEVIRLEAATPRDSKKIREAKESKRCARAAVIEACVIDHDAETFASVVPIVDPQSPQGQELIKTLVDIGFTSFEAVDALALGVASKPFARSTCAAFYERCQPDQIFATNLLRFINRFQRCDSPTPEQYWLDHGAPPLPLAPKPEKSP